MWPTMTNRTSFNKVGHSPWWTGHQSSVVLLAAVALRIDTHSLHLAALKAAIRYALEVPRGCTRKQWGRLPDTPVITVFARLMELMGFRRFAKLSLSVIDCVRVYACVCECGVSVCMRVLRT